MAKVPPFSELLAATTSSAVHLESRDTYTPDDPAFLDWKSGKPVPDPAGSAWYDLVRKASARGVRFRRARVVSEPLTEYIQFEYESTHANITAGEQVRWLPRRSVPGLLIPLADFWVLDGRLVRFGHFAGDGEFLGDELTDDAQTAQACAEAFEAVWRRGIPHDQYKPA